MQTISALGLAFLKAQEGCVLKAYKDPKTKSGLPITIGYGATRYQDGSKIQLGDVISQAQAETLLEWGLQKRAAVINSLGLKLNQNQYDAIMSLSYNIGVGAFADSTLRKLIKKNPQDPAIEKEWLRWMHVGGVPDKALLNRRKREYALYTKP